MKHRQGFVSNSSSSSFIVRKDFLSPSQIQLIKNHHLEDVRNLFMEEEDIYSSDAWSITEDDEYLMGDTSMDNFNMHEFCEKHGINVSKMLFGEYGVSQEEYEKRFGKKR